MKFFQRGKSMRINRLVPIIVLLSVLSGCGTTQDVLLVKSTGAKVISTVKQRPENGNSEAMDKNLALALAKESVVVNGQVAAYAQKAEGVDAIVSYVDNWQWDLAMYMRSLSIRFYDAESGDLIIVGNWADSRVHGFRDSGLVAEELIKEMMVKLRTAVSNR